MSKAFLWESALEANDEDTRGGGHGKQIGKIEICEKSEKKEGTKKDKMEMNKDREQERECRYRYTHGNGI